MSADNPPSQFARERRAGAPSEERVQQMIKEALAQAITEHDQDMRNYLRNEFAQLNALIRSGYPDGDPVGHRLAHEEDIASAKRWSALKSAVLEKVATGGVWGLIIFLGMAAWEHFKRGVST